MDPPHESDKPLSDAELALHLAGGTLAAWQAVGESVEAGNGLFGADEDGWRRARLAAGCEGRLLAARAGRRDDRSREGHPSAVASRLEALQAPGALTRQRERLGELGVRMVGWRSPSYPPDLLALPQPPLALAILGRWPAPPQALAMVGSRAATAYGLRVARRAGRSAAGLGLAVVSGLARGIDRAALEGCEEGGGWMVAVLGCGIDIAYPPQNRALQQRIAEHGTLVSEFALGQRPDRWTFPRRNRVIAALADAVLVVEAGERSGALITVDHAVEIGRDILAVPGPIDAPLSRGCNRLLADGATPLLEPARLGDALGLAPRPARDEVPDDPLLAALGDGACDIDALARRVGWALPRTRSRLIALELAGAVQRGLSGRWERR